MHLLKQRTQLQSNKMIVYKEINAENDMSTNQINKLFKKTLTAIKNSNKMVELADKHVDNFGGKREDFLRGFAAKAMRKTYPELY